MACCTTGAFCHHIVTEKRVPDTSKVISWINKSYSKEIQQQSCLHLGDSQFLLLEWMGLINKLNLICIYSVICVIHTVFGCTTTIPLYKYYFSKWIRSCWLLFLLTGRSCGYKSLRLQFSVCPSLCYDVGLYHWLGSKSPWDSMETWKWLEKR